MQPVCSQIGERVCCQGQPQLCDISCTGGHNAGVVSFLYVPLFSPGPPLPPRFSKRRDNVITVFSKNFSGLTLFLKEKNAVIKVSRVSDVCM